MTYTKDIGDRICAMVAEGTTLAEIGRMPGMPARPTIYEWLKQQPEFAAAMDIARDLGADAIAEEALRIADTPEEGVEYEIGSDGDTKEKRSDMLGHRKLRVDTRLKLLAKWHPKKYGEKLTAEHTGAGGTPLTVQILRFGGGDGDDSSS